MDNKYQLLLDEVRQNFASAVWSHKIQEKQADIYGERYNLLETVKILAASLTSCGIISTIFCDNLVAKIITAILSFITLSITTYFKSFDVKNMEMQCKNTAKRLIVVRNDLMHIIAEIHMKEHSVEDINSNYIRIKDTLHEIYIEAPTTTQKAVERATKALKVDDEYTYSDDEIDNFLPPTLRGKVE